MRLQLQRGMAAGRPIVVTYVYCPANGYARGNEYAMK